jgi:hypothetical protein
MVKLVRLCQFIRKGNDTCHAELVSVSFFIEILREKHPSILSLSVKLRVQFSTISGLRVFHKKKVSKANL